MVFEACSFWPAFVEAVEGKVAELYMVHPQRVKAIASAKLKNDRVDSHTLAHLLRADLLPQAWLATGKPGNGGRARARASSWGGCAPG